MSRLTKKSPNGGYCIDRSLIHEIEGGDLAGTAVNELAAYESAKEDGLLVWLPCPVGSTIYRIKTVFPRETNFQPREEVIEAQVIGFGVKKVAYIQVVDEMRVRQASSVVLKINSLGSTFFLTRPEAESALREREAKKSCNA